MGWRGVCKENTDGTDAARMDTDGGSARMLDREKHEMSERCLDRESHEMNERCENSKDWHRDDPA